MPPAIPMTGEASYAARRSEPRVRQLDYIVVLICMVFIPSAVAHGLLGISERTAFALGAPVLLAAVLFTNRLKVHRSIPMLFMALAVIGTLASAIAMSTSQMLMGIALGVSVVVGRQLMLTLGNPKVLRAVSWFTLALLVGGIIGIVYSAIGGQPLREVQVGYRTTYLYLTTFSFAFIGDFIRPAGIFDEPGAFAMYVTLVTMFNDTMRQNPKLNLALILLLVFTGALAGVALAAWYMLSSNAMRSRRKRNIGIISGLFAVYLAMSVVFPANLVTTTLDTFYSDRFQIEDGRLAGDNRSNQVATFFELVDGEMLLKGTKDAFVEYEAEDMSSNPFSITYRYGLLISLPYFALLFWLAGTTLHQGFRNSYTSIGLLLLLLQRPYLNNMSWSILIAATVWLLYHAAQERRTRRVVPQ